jgi:intracellular sulfur oxidation DsrE/DsrF family protein
LVKLIDSPDDFIAEKAITTLGNIAAVDDSEHCELVLQSGIVKSLLRLLKRTCRLSILKAASKTFAVCWPPDSVCGCCHPKCSDFSTVEAGLDTITELLTSNDKDILLNACQALFRFLDELNYEEVNAVISMGEFVKPLLALTSQGLPDVQEIALKSLYLIATAGDECIQAITDCDGIASIKTALSSSHEKTQQLACCAISNIIAGDKERIQLAIDGDVVPCLVQVLSSEKNKKHALWSLYTATKNGSAEQIKYLVTKDCVRHLCSMLVTRFMKVESTNSVGQDCNTAIIALWALKNVSTEKQKG